MTIISFTGRGCQRGQSAFSLLLPAKNIHNKMQASRKLYIMDAIAMLKIFIVKCRPPFLWLVVLHLLGNTCPEH